MKKYVLFHWLIALFSACAAWGTGLSQTNNGVYLAVSGRDATELIPADQKLVWHAYSINGPVELAFPDPSYLVKFSMIGPFGNEINKTSLGRSFGANFDKVHRFEDVIHGWHIGSVMAEGRYDERDGSLSGPLLPAPAELFKIDKPGIYTLTIQMQMFRLIKGTNLWTHELIRFSSIKVDIVKPQE